MKYDNKLEYIVYENTETFALIDKETGYRNYHNKYQFLSFLISFLNMSNHELTNIENKLGPLKYVLPIKSKPYIKEKKLIKKAKEYIDKSIENPLYSKYETFKLACELEYFNQITSFQFHDLGKFDKWKEQNEPENDFDRIDYIYKCCQQDKIKLVTAYELKDFEDFIVASLTELFKSKKTIVKCKNCGKYFLPKRKDALYCNNPSPQEPSKPCNKYVPESNYNESKQNDPAKKLHRKIYQRLNKDKKRNPRSPYIENFKNFNNEVDIFKDKLKDNKITKEDYYKWLEEQDLKYTRKR